ISTSVARLMPSISECRQPYLLSNLLLVTESLTLIAGKSNSPAAARWYSRSTPVVVSSVTHISCGLVLVQYCGSFCSERRSRSRMTAYSCESSSVADGTTPAFSYCTPLWISRVASPPSSNSMLGPCSDPSAAAGQCSIWSVHHQYSSSVSPFQA